MFHFENEKIENTEKPQEYKKEGDSGWLNIPFKEKNNENGDELSDKNFHNQEKKPWVEIPYDGDDKHSKDKPWVNLPFQHFENDDDSYDEDSIREDDWESDEFEGYESKSEKKQWEEDHPNGPSFEEALADDEEYGTSTVDDWRDYRDAKCDSDAPELFESYEEWQEKKERWDETHPNGPSYAEARQDGITEVSQTSDTPEQAGLTSEQKEQIKKETGWSDEIINHIENMDQYEIYKNADLHEAEINGKKCLVKNIDMDYVDPKTGLTNRELMQKGRSPIDSKTGEKIELHHMGQDKDGPFAELCENSEHGDGNHSILHPKTDGSWRNEDGANANYDKVERPNHWKARAQEV